MSARNTETIDSTVRAIHSLLQSAGIESAVAEAELILAHVLDESRGRIRALAVMGAEISTVDRLRALTIAEERASRVPLQHLTGRAPFRNIELSVGPGVFVPRPETEVTAQHALDTLAGVADPLVVDLCTGSAAIALSIAHEVAGARVWAIEMSEAAHAWAKRNVDDLGDGRVTLLLGDAAEALTLLPQEILGRVHTLVSNPPYVPEHMVPRDPEVREHDPGLALYSGADGLDLIRVISRVAREVVRPGGAIVLEHGELQGEAIRRILARDGWHARSTFSDLTGRDRVTTAKQPAESKVVDHG